MATNPLKARRRPLTSSIGPPPESGDDTDKRSENSRREGVQQHDENESQHHRPELGVRRDLLIERRQRERADERSPELSHAAKDHHDQHFGRFRPVSKIRKDAAIEDSEQRTGKP